MREVVGLTVYPPGRGRELSEALREIVPAGFNERSGLFSVTFDSTESQFATVLDLLARFDMSPWTEIYRAIDREREYSIERRRYYSDADLAGCVLLELGFTLDHPATPCDGRTKQRTGNLILKKFPARAVSYASSSCFTIVTDAVRQALEAEGLAKDAIFLPTEKRDRPQVPVWELRSMRTLPPVAPSMTLFEDDYKTPFQGNYEHVCVRREGVYLQTELHYRAADIEAMGPFDLAHTKERFGEAPFDEYRPLVVSARFYEMCRRHKFKGGFTPVRIDP